MGSRSLFSVCRESSGQFRGTLGRSRASGGYAWLRLALLCWKTPALRTFGAPLRPDSSCDLVQHELQERNFGAPLRFQTSSPELSTAFSGKVGRDEANRTHQRARNGPETAEMRLEKNANFPKCAPNKCSPKSAPRKCASKKC